MRYRIAFYSPCYAAVIGLGLPLCYSTAAWLGVRLWISTGNKWFYSSSSSGGRCIVRRLFAILGADGAYWSIHRSFAIGGLWKAAHRQDCSSMYLKPCTKSIPTNLHCSGIFGDWWWWILFQRIHLFMPRVDAIYHRSIFGNNHIKDSCMYPATRMWRVGITRRVAEGSESSEVDHPNGHMFLSGNYRRRCYEILPSRLSLVGSTSFVEGKTFSVHPLPASTRAWPSIFESAAIVMLW